MCIRDRVITEHNDKNKALAISFDEFTFYNIDFTYYDKIIDGKYIVKDKSYIRFLSDDFDKVLEIIDGKNEQGDPFIKLDKVSHINIQTGNKLSLSLIVSVIATLVVVGIISGKMKLHRKYPKSATFIALLSATVIIGVIKAIIGSIFTVFVVATISWGAYCLEDAYFKSLQPVNEDVYKRQAYISSVFTTVGLGTIQLNIDPTDFASLKVGDTANFVAKWENGYRFPTPGINWYQVVNKVYITGKEIKSVSTSEIKIQCDLEVW